MGINLPIFWKLALPISMINAAVIAEIVRAGIRALDRGQTEAAGNTKLLLQAFVVVSLIYIVINLALTRLATTLEARIQHVPEPAGQGWPPRRAGSRSGGDPAGLAGRMEPRPLR